MIYALVTYSIILCVLKILFLAHFSIEINIYYAFL